MKTIRIALIIVLSTLISYSSYAQFKIGVKAGLSSYNLSPGDLLILNSADFQDFRLKVNQADLGVQFGIMTQINIGNFVIQPEVLFNSNAVDFRLEDIDDEGIVGRVFEEKYQNIDVPFLLGARLGPFRIMGGPVAHFHINSTSELFDLKGYAQKFNEFTYGYQTGIGLDLWSFHFDLRYEGNFYKFGEHIVWNDTEYHFDDSPSRILASLSITF